MQNARDIKRGEINTIKQLEKKTVHLDHRWYVTRIDELEIVICHSHLYNSGANTIKEIEVQRKNLICAGSREINDKTSPIKKNSGRRETTENDGYAVIPRRRQMSASACNAASHGQGRCQQTKTNEQITLAWLEVAW